jgi:hypothetical protein
MFSKTHTYAPRLYKTPWNDLEPCHAALGHGGCAALANPGEPAVLPVGEVIGLDHKLTWDPRVAKVGAGKSPTWAHGEDRRWQPRRAVLWAREASGLPTSKGYGSHAS